MPFKPSWGKKSKAETPPPAQASVQSSSDHQPSSSVDSTTVSSWNHGASGPQDEPQQPFSSFSLTDLQGDQPENSQQGSAGASAENGGGVAKQTVGKTSETTFSGEFDDTEDTSQKHAIEDSDTSKLALEGVQAETAKEVQHLQTSNSKNTSEVINRPLSSSLEELQNDWFSMDQGVSAEKRPRKAVYHLKVEPDKQFPPCMRKSEPSRIPQHAATSVWLERPSTHVQQYAMEFTCGPMQAEFEAARHSDVLQAARILREYVSYVRQKYWDGTAQLQAAITQMVIFCLESCDARLQKLPLDTVHRELLDMALQSTDVSGHSMLDKRSLRAWGCDLMAKHFRRKKKYSVALSWTQKAIKSETRQEYIPIWGSHLANVLFGLFKYDQALEVFRGSIALLQQLEQQEAANIDGIEMSLAVATLMFNCACCESRLYRPHDALIACSRVTEALSLVHSGNEKPDNFSAAGIAAVLKRKCESLQAQAQISADAVLKVPLNRVPTRRSGRSRPSTPSSLILESTTQSLNFGSNSPAWRPPVVSQNGSQSLSASLNGSAASSLKAKLSSAHGKRAKSRPSSSADSLPPASTPTAKLPPRPSSSAGSPLHHSQSLASSLVADAEERARRLRHSALLAPRPSQKPPDVGWDSKQGDPIRRSSTNPSSSNTMPPMTRVAAGNGNERRSASQAAASHDFVGAPGVPVRRKNSQPRVNKGLVTPFRSQ